MRYWINTISEEHVQRGVRGGFTQADHGAATRLRRLEKGDLMAFYSPRTAFRSGEPRQSFTALGRVADDEPYQVTLSPAFKPWRRRMTFLRCQPAKAQPLIPQLSFIRDKTRWGFPFRRGLFPIDAEDFARIAEAMKARL
jgi:hypothetical protein